MTRRPVVFYDDGELQVLSFTISQRPWIPDSIGVGGSSVAAAGAGEAFEVRRDEILEVRLRFFEMQWPAVRAWLTWAQRTQGSFYFYMEAGVPASARLAYLHSPQMGESMKPERGEYPGTYERTVELRSADGTPWDRAYFS